MGLEATALRDNFCTQVHKCKTLRIQNRFVFE